MRRLLAPLPLAKKYNCSDIQLRFLTTSATAKTIFSEATNETRKSQPSYCSDNTDKTEVSDVSLKELIRDALPYVFVSMCFEKTRQGFYRDTLKLAVQDAGIICCRIDNAVPAGSIPENIQNAIENCQVFVADVGDRNSNVMLEVGSALALSKPLVLICNRALNDQVPFNIKHLRRILYDDHGPGRHILRHELTKTIRAILRD